MKDDCAMPTLKNYVLLEKNGNQYLYGRVYGDKRFPNGHLVLTSNIEEIDDNSGKTLNTTYKLENKLSKKEMISSIKKSYSVLPKESIDFYLAPLNQCNVVGDDNEEDVENEEENVEEAETQE